MPTIEILLSIVASVFSIASTVIALQNKSEIKKLRDLYLGNHLDADGSGNAQVLGSGNRVTTHVR